MLQKIAKIITNNFGLKVLSVVIAVVFWLVIVNVEDPERTKVFSVPVVIENENYLRNMGKTYEILDKTDTITFTVTAKRSVIERVSASDFAVTANMQDIIDMSKIPVTVVAQKYANQLTVTKRSQYVEVFVEDEISKTFDIESQIQGTVLGGYSMDEVSISPEQVSVTGPRSVVENIQKAVAVVNVESLKEDAEKKVKLAFYDKKGNAVSQERLQLSTDTAVVSVGIAQKKTVPVRYEAGGTPEEGYRIGDVTGSIQSLVLQGEPEVMEALSEIVVSGKALDVTGKTEDLTVTVDLGNYLPEGVSLVEDSPKKRLSDVAIEIQGRQTADFGLLAENIELKNVLNGMQAVLRDTMVTVTLQGYESELEEISAADLKGEVDLAEYNRPGTYQIPVKILGGYSVSGTVYVKVELKQEEQNGDTPEEPGSPGDAGTE